MNSQKTPHTSPFRASYGVSFMSTSTEIDRVIKGFYCSKMTTLYWNGALMTSINLQYIPRNMHTVFALLCFVVVIHWLIFPYPSGLLHWHCGNLTIAPVPAKQPWWIWINTSCEFIMNDYITTTKQSTTKPCAYFLGYTVSPPCQIWMSIKWSLEYWKLVGGNGKKINEKIKTMQEIMLHKQKTCFV